MSHVPPTLGSAREIHPSELAELAHNATAGRGPCIVGADHSGEILDLCLSEIPERFEHPGDSLLGFVAPDAWIAVGLSVPIRARRSGPADPAAQGPTVAADPASVDTALLTTEASRLTVMVQRDGVTTSIFDGPAMAPVLVAEPPEGWVPDLLRRSLGLPTAPPSESLASFVEASWLDAVAAEVFANVASGSDWATLAVLHPLHPPVPAMPGPLLAVETQALELESSWSRMRRLWAGSGPGKPARGRCSNDSGLDAWFDDGSFARWISRTVPEPAELLAVILTLVSADVGSEIVDALVSVTPPDQAAP